MFVPHAIGRRFRGKAAASHPRSAGRHIAAAAALTLAMVGLVVPQVAQADTAPPPTTPPTTATVSADPLPTVQIDGVVYAQAINGRTAYAAGSFTSARPAGAAAGTNETPRANILSYDVTTGVLNSSWNPGTNGRVLAASVSPDGTRLYIAGAFTAVAGQPRYRVAAFDTATGALVPNWAPGVNSPVYDIKATNSTVYITGEFTNANNTVRSKIAAFGASTGALLPFAPVLDGGYGGRALEISPDGAKVIVGGSFLTTNGSNLPGRGMAALDAVTGQLLPWAVNSVIRNAGTNSSIYALASDGDSVYGTGYDFGGTKTDDDFEGSFRARWSDGTLVWMEDCHGDTYSVFPMDGVVYKTGHAHYCGNIGEFPQLDPWVVRHSLAFDKEPSTRTITPDIWGYRSFTGQRAGKLLHWYPVWATGSATGVGQAGWDITANDKYLVYGGEFTAVNGVRQQGLVRFAKSAIAPNKVGPSVQGGAWALTASSFRAGQARLAWQANYDPDNAELTYQVFKRGVTAPLSTTKLSSTYWVRPTLTFTDRDLTPGQTYEYRIRATDPIGNTTVTDWTPVTVSSTGVPNAYDNAVLADAPRNYWPLREPSGTAAFDWAGGNDVTTVGVTRGVEGPTVPTATLASGFAGSSSSSAAANNPEQGPNTFSVEAWFKTSSTTGGKIVGFGDKRTGASSSYDRQIYLDGAGRVTFGMYSGGVRVVQSATGFNNGQWHHVVGTLSSGGQAFYLDGKRVGLRTDTTAGQAYQGYWRVGGDNVNGWPNVGSQYLAGSIADVAVYDKALTRDQVNAHWVASGRPSALNPAPSDAYGKAVYDLDPSLYWRLNESSGSTFRDAGREGVDGTSSGPVVLNQVGALVSGGTAAAFQPTRRTNVWSGATAVSSRAVAGPAVYSIETWFKTTTSTGGKLVGFGSSSSGLSSVYDRHVYMSTGGQLKFGTNTGQTNIVTSPQAYNDGQWHHVVAQQSSAGMQLFVDGTQVGSLSETGAQAYTGYWRIGGDNGWEGDPYWRGTLDEVAVYATPLTAQQVQQHYDIARTGAPNAAPLASFTSPVTDLTLSVDASASSDPDGSITGYAWDFGDGESGTGVTASHAYTTAGTYTVTLTVTDNRGAQTSMSRTVSVKAANVLPSASFTADATNLTVNVDASASSDPDGSITGYAWDFGDGRTGTAATTSHTYAAAGTYTVTLTVTDDRDGTDATTRSVTVTAAPNVPPTAAFTTQVADLSVSVDASTSEDPDGTITGYAWDFGDGESGTGASTSHTYAAAGTYTVTLTVTDDRSGTDSGASQVTVTAPNPPLAKDDFERTLASSWGSADPGGSWSLFYGNAAFSVGDGTGQVSLKPSETREARLTSVSQQSAVASVKFSSDVASVGGTTSVTLIGRQVGSSVYSARVRLEPAGTVRLYLLRDEVLLGSQVVANTYSPGQVVNLKLSVAGASPTTLKARAWVEGSPEPTTWGATATDATAAMQAAGFVGIRTAVSSVSTNAVTRLRFDSWLVTAP